MAPVSAGRGGGSRGLLLAGVVAGVVSVPALAGPRGERVSAGSASFQRSGAHTTITTSHRAIIDYSSFNLGAHESVTFVQPSQSSRVLNRIESAMPTVIDGSVTANGAVYFANPAGVIFGPNSVLNVGDLYAAAGRISNEDFLAGRDRFTDLSGEVANYGSIRAREGIALLGRRVANFGTLVAPEGMVTLAAADGVLIGRRGGHVFAKLTSEGDGGARAAGSVENHGSISAGSVSLGAGDHFALAVGGSSVISGGAVLVEGGAGSRVEVSGEITAAVAPGGDGGVVEVTGGAVALSGARIDASGENGGVVRIGGDVQGRGELANSGATLVDARSSIDVGSTGSGDAGSAVVWSDGRTVFEGSIDASAGSGDGGFVEVSGKGWLGFGGGVDVSSLRGVAGTLLLDPKNILITSAGSGIEAEVTALTDVDDFLDGSILGGADGTAIVDDALTSNLTDAQLVTFLSNGDVVLLAENDILFGGTSPIDITSGSGNSLELRALRSISDADTGATTSVNIDLGTGVMAGDFVARANYTPGADEIARVTQRDAGDGVISLGNTTVTARNAAFQIGAGYDGLRGGGDIVLPGTTVSGVTLVQSLATRSVAGAGGSVSGGSISAGTGRVVFDMAPGLNGSVGTVDAPLSVSAGSVSASANGGVFLRLDSLSTGIETSQTGDLSGAGLVGFELSGGEVQGLRSPMGTVGITSSQSLVIGTSTGAGLNIDATELGLISADSISFVVDPGRDVTLRDADPNSNVFAPLAGRALELSGDTVTIASDSDGPGADFSSFTNRLGVDFLGVTADVDLDLTGLNGIDLGAAGSDLSFTLPNGVGLVNGAGGPGGETFGAALLGTFGGASGFGSLAVTAGGAVDLTVPTGVTLFDGRGVELTGSTVSVTLGASAVVTPNALTLSASSAGADAIDFSIDPTATLGDAMTAWSLSLTNATPGGALIGDVGAAGGGEGVLLDGTLFAGGGGTQADLGSLTVLTDGVVTLAETGSELSFLDGRVVSIGGVAMRPVVDVVGSDSTAFGVRDLSIASSSLTLSGVTSVGDLVTPGAFSLELSDSIGVLEGTGVFTLDRGTLTAWSFEDWAFRSDGAVEFADNDGNFGFEPFAGGDLVLAGDTVTLATSGSTLSLASLSVEASASSSSIVIGPDFDFQPIQVTGELSFSTAEDVSVGAANGGFELTTELLEGWTFGSLSVASTGGAVEFEDANGFSAGTLFDGPLNNGDLTASASTTLTVRGVDLVGGGDGIDPIAFSSLDLTAPTVVFDSVASLALGGGAVIDGAVRFENSPAAVLTGSGTLGRTTTAGSSLMVNAGSSLTLGDGADFGLTAGFGVYSVVVDGDLAVGSAGDVGPVRLGVTGPGVSRLDFQIDAAGNLSTDGPGVIDGGGVTVRFESDGALAVGGSAASADADVLASTVGAVTNFGALEFFSGGDLTVDGLTTFYPNLVANGIVADARLGFVSDGVISFAATPDMGVLTADVGGSGSGGVLIDAGGRSRTAPGFADVEFLTAVVGVSSDAGGNAIVADSLTIGSSFTIAEGAMASSSVVLNSGSLSAGALNLDVGTLNGASLGGVFDVSAAVFTVGGGLASRYAPGAAAPGLSVSVNDLEVGGGAFLDTGAGLLTLTNASGGGIGIGTSGFDVFEIGAASFTDVTFGTLALNGPGGVRIENGAGDAVFGTMAEEGLFGRDVTVVSGSNDLTIAQSGGSGALLLSALTHTTTGGDLVFAGGMTSLAVTGASTLESASVSMPSLGMGSAFSLGLGVSSFGASAVDFGAGDLTLGGVLNATSPSLTVTAGSVALGAIVDFVALNGGLNEGADLTFTTGAFTVPGVGTINGVGRLAFEAGAADIVVGDVSGVMSGVALSTAALQGVTLDAMAGTGDGVVLETSGSVTFRAASGLEAELGKIAEIGAALGGDAAELVWDAGGDAAVVGDDPGSGGSPFTLTGALFANARFGALRVRSDGEVRIGETAVPSILGALSDALVVEGSTGASPTATLIDARGGDVFLGESTGAGFTLGTATIGLSSFGGLEVLTNGDVTVGFDAGTVVSDGLANLAVRGSALADTGGVAGTYTLDVGARNVLLGDGTPGAGDFELDSAALSNSSFTTLGLSTTGSVTVGEDMDTNNDLLPGLLSNLSLTAGTLTIDARELGIGLAGGASDITLAESFFDNVSGGISFLTDGELVLGPGAGNYAYLAAGLTTDGSALDGSTGSGVGSILFTGGSGVISVDSLNLSAANAITFGAGITGLTSTSASVITSGPDTIVHLDDFTYNGEFTLTGSIDAGANTLTFENGTATVVDGVDGVASITAGTLVVGNGTVASVLRSGAGDVLEMTLGVDLSILALGQVTTTDTGAMMPGSVVRIVDGSAGDAGIRLGDGTGAPTLLIGGAELGRLGLTDRALELASAGEVSIVETLGGDVQSLFDLSGMRLNVGSSTANAGSVSFGSLAGGTVFTLSGLDVRSVGPISFGATVSGLTSGSGNTLRLETTGDASMGDVITHAGGFAYSGDFNLIGGLSAAGAAITFADGAYGLGATGAAFELDAATLRIEQAGVGTTAVSSSDSVTLRLSDDLVIADGDSSLEVGSGGTLRIETTGGVSLGASSAGFDIDLDEVDRLMLADARLELVGVGASVIVDGEGVAPGDNLDGLFGGLSGFLFETTGALTVTDNGATGGLAFANFTTLSASSVIFDATVDDVTFGDGMTVASGASLIADEVRFEGAPTVAVGLGVGATLTGTSEARITGANVAFSGGDLTVTDQDLTIDVTGSLTLGAGNPLITVVNGDLLVDLNNAATLSLVGASNGFTLTSGTLTFDVGTRSFGLLGGVGDVVIDAAGIGRLSTGALSIRALGGLAIEGTAAAVNALLDGDTLGAADSIGTFAFNEGIAGAAVSLDVGANAIVLDGTGVDINTAYVADFGAINATDLSIRADAGITFAAGVTSLDGVLSLRTTGPDTVDFLDTGTVTLAFGAGSVLAGGGLTFAGDADLSGAVSIENGGDFEVRGSVLTFALGSVLGSTPGGTPLNLTVEADDLVFTDAALAVQDVFALSGGRLTLRSASELSFGAGSVSGMTLDADEVALLDFGALSLFADDLVEIGLDGADAIGLSFEMLEVGGFSAMDTALFSLDAGDAGIVFGSSAFAFDGMPTTYQITNANVSAGSLSFLSNVGVAITGGGSYANVTVAASDTDEGSAVPLFAIDAGANEIGLGPVRSLFDPDLFDDAGDIVLDDFAGIDADVISLFSDAGVYFAEDVGGTLLSGISGTSFAFGSSGNAGNLLTLAIDARGTGILIGADSPAVGEDPFFVLRAADLAGFGGAMSRLDLRSDLGVIVANGAGNDIAPIFDGGGLSVSASGGGSATPFLVLDSGAADLFIGDTPPMDNPMNGRVSFTASGLAALATDSFTLLSDAAVTLADNAARNLASVFAGTELSVGAIGDAVGSFTVTSDATPDPFTARRLAFFVSGASTFGSEITGLRATDGAGVGVRIEGGPFEFANTGVTTIGSAADSTVLGGASIVAAGELLLEDAVDLAGTASSLTAGGDLTFASTLDSSAGSGVSVTIVDAGMLGFEAAFEAAVGDVSPVGDIEINGAQSVRLGSTVTAESFRFVGTSSSEFSADNSLVLSGEGAGGFAFEFEGGTVNFADGVSIQDDGGGQRYSASLFNTGGDLELAASGALIIDIRATGNAFLASNLTLGGSSVSLTGVAGSAVLASGDVVVNGPFVLGAGIQSLGARFNNGVTVSSTGSVLTGANGAQVGNVNLTGGTLRVEGGGVATFGNVTSTGGTSLVVDKPAGSVVFNGTTYQATVFDLNAPSFAVGAAGDFTFGGATTTGLTISGGSFTLNAGTTTFDASAGTLTVNAPLTPAGAGTSLSLVAQNLVASGGIGAALSRFDSVALGVDTATLSGVIEADEVTIDTLDPGRPISLGVASAGALSLTQAGIASALNGGSVPIGTLQIGTGDNGGVSLSGATFSASVITIGNGSSTVSIAGESGAVGAGGADGSLTFAGPVTLEDGTAVASAGRSLEFTQEITVSGDVSIASAGGAIVLGGPDDTDPTQTDDIVADGAGATMIIDAGEGSVSLPGLGSSGDAFASVTVTGGEIRFNGTIDADVQSYTAGGYFVDAPDGLTLLSDDPDGSIVFDPGGSITTGGTLLSIGAADAPIAGTISLAPIIGEAGAGLAIFSLADVTLAGIGADAPIDTVAVSAGTLTLGDVSTSGGQSYTAADGISLAGALVDSGAGGVSFLSPLTVTGDSTVTGGPGGTVLFDQLVTLEAALSVNAETASLLAGLLGGTHTLSVSGGSLLVIDTLAAGAFDIASTLELQGDTVLDATMDPGLITLAAVTGSGTETLTLLAGNSTGTGTAALGSVGGLATLRVQADRLEGTPTDADVGTIVLLPFTPGTDISVGDDVEGSLNLSQAFIDAVSLGANPNEPGESPVTIGEAGFAGQIIIGNAVFKAPTTLSTDGLLISNGFTVFGGTSVTLAGLTGNLINGDIGPSAAVPGAFTLNVPTAALLGADSVLTAGGGTLLFDGGLNAQGGVSPDLTVDLGGGTLGVAGVLGGDGPIGSFTLTSSGVAVLPSVSTTGDQTYTAPTLTLTDATLSAAGGVSFNGLVSVGGVGVVDADGVVALGGTLAGDGELQVEGSSLTFAVDIPSFDGAVVSTAPVSFAVDRSVAATRLEFLGGLVAPGAGTIVSLSAIERLSVVGGAGSFADRFDRLAFSGAEVLLGGEFHAQNGIEVFGPAFIVGESTLLRSYELSADAGIRFRSTVDTAALVDGGVAGGATLTLYVNRQDEPETSLDLFSGLLPRIELFADVGSISELGTLNLNFSGSVDGQGIEANTDQLPGRGFVPVETSIVVGDLDAFDELGQFSNVTINVGTLNMGDREKLISIGSLTINATSPATARLGDVTALGDLVVNSPNVVLVARESGEVFDSTANIFTSDIGTDFVADGSVTFGNVTQIVSLTPGAQRPQFANPNGDAAIASGVGGFTIFALTDDLAGLALAGGESGLAIDVRAQGATNTNIATVLAGATPRTEGDADIESEAEIDAATLATLQELGINARPAGEDTSGVGLLKVDLSDRPGEQPAVSIDRLESTVVALVIEAYRGLFTEERDGRTTVRRREISRRIADAVDAYFEQTEAEDFELEAFAEFMAASEDESVVLARGLIAELQDLEQLLRLLGLTERELAGPRNALFGLVRPRDIPREEWNAIIEGRVLRVSTAEGATPEPPEPPEPATSPAEAARRGVAPARSAVAIGATDATAARLWATRVRPFQPGIPGLDPFGG